jgi:HEAT repeat protein
MRSQRGKAAARWSVVIALTTLVGAAWLFRGKLAERWYISRLENENEEVRRDAVENLRRMRSVRAVPHFVRIRSREVSSSVVGEALLAIASERRQAVIPVLLEVLKDESQLVSGEAADVLVDLGGDAIPALVETLGDENAQARSWSAHSLGRIGPEAAAAVPALKTLQRDECREVRFESDRALKRIQADLRVEAVDSRFKS